MGMFSLLKLIGALFKPVLADNISEAHYYKTALYDTAKYWRGLASTEYAVLVGGITK